jgi:radical SAM superfamily enzyme YgiQ (UPF0313 family)
MLSPKGPLYRHGSGIFRQSLRPAPLTLTTLAALVPPELDARVTLLDEGIRDIPDEIDADLIGVTVITGNAPRAYELADRYRARGKTVVMGGPHPTLVPDDAAPHADAVVTGYAEDTWPELLRDFVAGNLRPRYDMSPGFRLDRPEALPFPRRDLLPKRGYRSHATFEATRGCVHHCDFCVVPSAWGTSPWQKPVGHVVDDIRRTGKKNILFFDLNIIANRAYAKELFAALVPLKVKWFGLATALVAEDDELLDLLSRSGCRGLLIGFESVSDESLAAVSKGFSSSVRYAEIVARLHAIGIAINGTFVFGSDADGPDCFDAAKEFVLENHIDLPRFSILTPFPGTPLHDRLAGEDRILTLDWSLYDGQHVVHRPSRMTPEALMEGHERVWREVYRWRPIFSRCRRARSSRALLLAANVGFRFYARNLSRFYSCAGGLC